MSVRPLRWVAVLVLLMLFAPIASATSLLAAPGFPVGPVVTSDRQPTGQLPQRWIVQLKNPPLAQIGAVDGTYAVMRNTPRARLQLNSPVAQEYRTLLQQQQQATFTALRSAFPQAKLQRSYQIVMNAIAVSLPNEANPVAKLQSLPQVAAVYPDQLYELDMFSSIPQIGADVLWKDSAIGGQNRAGEGIKVAVIDSGIHIDHPSFNPEGYSYPAGFPKGDTQFTTPKVIAARAYFRPDMPPIEGSNTPIPGPDDSSHGTHVAGTVAGNANTTATFGDLSVTLSGVAPRAYLMNYKVFYENESVLSGSAFGVELIAALEDAVADGADVINNSWGGRADAAPFADPITVAADAAVDAGVVVVFSAGNEGPNPSTAGSPGYSEKVITVGASTTGQTLASGFIDVVSPDGAPENLKEQPYGSAEFGRQLINESFGPTSYVHVADVAGSSLACDPLPEGSLTGKLALIERGTCNFSLKVYHAQLAGANAAIIYNSEAGGEELISMAAGDNAELIYIPSVSVTRSVGLGLIEWRGQHGDAAQLVIDGRPRLVEFVGDVLADFSSRGPTFQTSLKPDIVAPGVNILSSGYGSAPGSDAHLGFGIASGTSMASPHVAGAAALLLQVNPNWKPLDVKSAMMSTAVKEVWLDLDKTEPAGILDSGAGRIDLTRAAHPGLLFDRPSLSYGPQYAPSYNVVAVTARNVSGSSQTYTLSSRTIRGDFRIAVSPSSITIPAGGSAVFEVALDLPAGAPAGDYEGWVELDGATGHQHLPLWARVLPAERNASKVLLLDNDGSSSWGFDDYSGYYGNALGTLGIPFTYIDLDELAGEPQTLPSLAELQTYDIVLLFTGDNYLPDGAATVPTPLTATDQDNLIAYLQSGGNLIATGQDVADATDINNSSPNDPTYYRSDLYHSYLGARFVQDDVFIEVPVNELIVSGTASQQWTNDIALNLSWLEDVAQISDATGAANQYTVDEIGVIDTDPRMPDRYTTPIFQAHSPNAMAGGIVGLNRSAEPTLEDSKLGIPYRTTYLSFGLEGVRSDTGNTSRVDLLQRLINWHIDRPSVEINGPVTTTEANQEVTLTANAQSNTSTYFFRYRWDFGDGSAIVETDQPSVAHQYANPGTYTPRVEVTNTWGHKAVSSAGASGQAVVAPSAQAQTFAETGQTLSGRFLSFWQQQGGLSVFGFPISAEQGSPLGQVFERNRLEYHPENAAPYDVLLGRLGAEALEKQGRDWRDFATVDSAAPNCLYFAETQHSLCGEFLSYWQGHGLEFDGQAGSSYAESLALFGYPLSEPQIETNPDGDTVLVQWFERARFEYHPQNEAPYQVLLGRLGHELYGSSGIVE